MRKIYFAALLSFSFLAISAHTGNTPVWKLNTAVQDLKPALNLNKITSTSTSYARMAPATGDDPITVTPQGTLYKSCYMIGRGYYAGYGNILPTNSDGNVVDVVDADNELYVFNPMSTLITNTWLRGNKKKASIVSTPDTVEVPLPQPIFKKTLTAQDGSDSVVVLYLNNIIYDNRTNSYYASPNNTVRYTWSGDTLKKIDNGDVLAVTDRDGNWYGYGDSYTEIFQQQDVPTTLPENYELKKYAFKYYTTPENSKTRFINVAKDGNDLYIDRPDEDHNFFVKGTIKGDKVVFGKQYLGIDSAYLTHRYFWPATVKYTLNEDWGIYDIATSPLSELQFTYDATTGDFSTQNAFVLNYGKLNIGSSSLYDLSSLQAWIDKAYIPKTPSIVDIMPYDPESYYGGVKFDLPIEDVNGTYVDPNNLYYEIFINDANHPYTFTPELNTNLTENMTVIPATFTDYYDFKISGTVHTVFINDSIFQNVKVGVKSIYKWGEQTNESPIVWEEVSGVDGVEHDHGEVRNILYTDLSGRVVKTPNGGFYVKTIRYADGFTVTTKVIE